MAIPSKITGGGNTSVAQKVIRVTFSEATSDRPKLEAWDDYAFAATTHEIFTGTAGNSNQPMLCAVGTTDAAPTSDWAISTPVGGGATINLLKGSTDYVFLSAASIPATTPGTDDYVTFNVNWEIPSDASIPSDLAAVLVIRFSYGGSAPILTWDFNDSSEGGTEGTPYWTTITPGIAGHKIKPADVGSTPSTVVLHRPVSGTQDAGEIWVVV